MFRRKYKTKFKLLYKLLYLILMATPVNCQNEHMHRQDHMGRADKEKMMNLADDLLKDAHLKMRQIIEIRTEHEIFVSYNIGILIGKINEKYRNMIEAYKDIMDKDKKRHTFMGPGINVLRTVHYIIAMEMIHALEVEIDHMIHVLEKSAAEDMAKDSLTVGGSGGGGVMRIGQEREEEDEEGEADIQKEAEEELAKSMLREQYLMKRLGLPQNTSTTKKRFMDNWPVEDTWSMENNPLY